MKQLFFQCQVIKINSFWNAEMAVRERFPWMSCFMQLLPYNWLQFYDRRHSAFSTISPPLISQCRVDSDCSKFVP